MIERKLKPCAECGSMFPPWNSLQAVCGPACAIKVAKRESAEKKRKEKEIRARHRKRREELKSRGDWTKEAQAAFNAWVRERDYGLPCISCDSTPDDSGLMTGSRIDAGHYRSRGAMPSLRFEPLNCHAQCVKCNRYLSGNTVEYRARLINRIGPDNLEWLEGEHPPKKFTIAELKQIKKHYSAQARAMKRAREQGVSEAGMRIEIAEVPHD